MKIVQTSYGTGGLITVYGNPSWISVNPWNATAIQTA